MANPLPNEFELYERIKKESIKIGPNLLDFLYHYIGDDVTAINLLCEYHLSNEEPIPAVEAERIFVYTKDIEFIINNIITKPALSHFPFPQFKDDFPLHPIIRDLFTYHFGNDIHVINLIVYDAIDPLMPEPRQVSIESIQKIIKRTTAIKQFLEKLRLDACA